MKVLPVFLLLFSLLACNNSAETAEKTDQDRTLNQDSGLNRRVDSPSRAAIDSAELDSLNKPGTR
jgi:hypothetical protein